MIVCDRCDRRADKSDPVEAITVRLVTPGRTEVLVEPGPDLCSRCQKRLREMIQEFFRPLPKPARESTT
jgi:hypothetical protein